VQFVRIQSSEKFIRSQSTYLNIVKEYKPSTWLKYFFSVYSTRDWVSERQAAETDGARPERPLMPDSIRYSADDIDWAWGGDRQIVVRADDERWKIRVICYTGSAADRRFDSVRGEEWDFPRFGSPASGER
jgi:hypothetical protein